MANERKQAESIGANRLAPAAGRDAVVRASLASGAHRLDPGQGRSDRPETKWGWRTIILGCLVWYLAVFCLLVLVGRFSPGRATDLSGTSDQPKPASAASPEGSARNQ
jgi:hypothetical protein